MCSSDLVAVLVSGLGVLVGVEIGSDEHAAGNPGQVGKRDLERRFAAVVGGYDDVRDIGSVRARPVTGWIGESAGA